MAHKGFLVLAVGAAATRALARHRPRLQREIIALALVTALFASLGLAACSSHSGSQPSAAVSTRGGTVPLSPGVGLRVAAGTAAGTTVRAMVARREPAYPGHVAMPVGSPVDIIPSGPLAASTVLMRFTPATELPAARPGVAAPTAGNAFIAVLNQATETWLPLLTRYDAAAHELSAVAPHFSAFQTFVLVPGRYFYRTAAGGISLLIRAGESGLNAAEAAGAAVWDALKPEYGASPRRTLPGNQRIYGTCSGDDPKLPWDRRYRIAVSDQNMQVRSCVVDNGGHADQPALLMENDYGFPVDVTPQETGAALPGLTIGTHPDQDAVAALNSIRNVGYIPGPGVTRIGLPAGTPPVFYVKVHADWLGLVTDVILSAAAIIPGFEAEETRFARQLEEVLMTEERDGQLIQSQTQVLKIVQTDLKAEKGPALEGAEHLTQVYLCAVRLAPVVLSDTTSDLAGKLADCLKELISAPGDAVPAGGIVSEGLKYIDSLIGFMQLPEVLNDFREHGRQTFIIDAVRQDQAFSQERFQPFGLSFDTFGWSAHDQQISITPPLGADRYSALWGVFDGQRRCAVTISLDSRLSNPQATGNFGVAIAPMSGVSGDQPGGASLQFEHEAPPDFPAAGSFIRPALLPSGAWRVDIQPVPAPDIYEPNHVQLTDNGRGMSIAIDGHHMATYAHQLECGGVAIRAWGAPFTFSNVVIQGS
jgi:hypothetical protein